MTIRPSPAVSFTSPWWLWMISRKLEKYVCTSWLSRFASSCSESFVYPAMSRNTTETSTVRFSSSVAFGFCSRSFLTASGTNFDSSPLSCSSSASRWRDSWRFCKAVSSSWFLVASSVWAMREPRRHVVEGSAELPDLVARALRHPRPEVAVADAPGDGRERRDRPDDDGAHRHRQDGRSGEDRQRRDEDLAVAVAPDLDRRPAPSTSRRAPRRAPCDRCRDSPGSSS